MEKSYCVKAWSGAVRGVLLTHPEAAVNLGAGRHGRACRGAPVAPHPRPGAARVQRARDRPQRRQLPLWSHPRRSRAARTWRGRAAPDAQCDRRRYSTNWYRESRQRDELEREKKPISKEGLSLSEIWLVTKIDFERDVDLRDQPDAQGAPILA